MKKALALLLCLVMTVSALAGCSSSGSSTETTTAGTNSGKVSETTQTEDGKTYKRIVVANSDSVVALDPAAAEDAISGVIVGNTIEGLFSVTPEGMVEPAMASKVEVSEDAGADLEHAVALVHTAGIHDLGGKAWVDDEVLAKALGKGKIIFFAQGAHIRQVGQFGHGSILSFPK